MEGVTLFNTYAQTYTSTFRIYLLHFQPANRRNGSKKRTDLQEEAAVRYNVMTRLKAKKKEQQLIHGLYNHSRAQYNIWFQLAFDKKKQRNTLQWTSFTSWGF